MRPIGRLFEYEIPAFSQVRRPDFGHTYIYICIRDGETTIKIKFSL